MSKPLDILVAGAGITGSAAVLFLARQGHRVTVIDKAASFQKLGYGLSLKSFGVGILEELGLLEELRKEALPADHILLCDGKGKLLKSFGNELTQKSLGGAVLVYRSQLHEVLHRAAERSVPVKFATTVQEVQERPEGVSVLFSDGTRGSFDLLVLAEGLHSSTRRRVLGEEGFRPFDLVYAATSVPREAWMDPTGIQVFTAPGRSLTLFPTGRDRILLQAYMRGGLKGRDPHHLTGLLKDSFKGFPPAIAHLVDGIEAAQDVFYDGVGIVTLPQLHRGRVVLLGDCGYCPSFLSGMGASLGLLGAKVLAQSLGSFPGDLEEALGRFDTVLQPVIGHYQKNAEKNLSGFLSTSPFTHWVRDQVTRFMPSGLLMKSFGKQFMAEDAYLAKTLRPAGMP